MLKNLVNGIKYNPLNRSLTLKSNARVIVVWFPKIAIKIQAQYTLPLLLNNPPRNVCIN